MSIYEKLLISTYSSFARTNRWDPAWSAISLLSLLHVFNLINFSLLSGISLDGMEKTGFVAIITGITAILMWIHYRRYLTNKSFAAKARSLNQSTKFWFGLCTLIYGIATYTLFFWIIKAPKDVYLPLCLVFIGIPLSSYLFSTKSKS